MSIQRRLYEKMAGLNQEKDIQEGPAHQNPLKTNFGGMKDAKNTPSMKAYYAQVKKDQASRAVKTAAEREKERLARRESVDLDELKQSTLRSYKDKAKKSERSGRDTGFEGETSSEREAGVRQVKKRVKGIDGATKRLVARQYEDVEQVDEVSSDTLRRYVYKRRGQVQSDLNTGKHSPKTNKKAKGVSAALSRLDARKNKLEPELKREDVGQVDELKLPSKDAKGNFKSNKVRRAFTKGAVKAQDASNRAMDKATSRGSDIDNTIKHIDRSLDAEGRRDDRKRKARKEEVEQVIEAKVGDTVHLGHATKGGSGVKGKVVKIDGRNVHIKNDKGAMFKGPMDRVTVGEAIKYDSAGDSTGTVTGKGKRDRGAGGEVKVKYKGSDTYKDGAKLPIKARDIGRLIKTARKKGTKPYDSRNLSNPRLTKDHVEHGVDEGIENMTPSQERDADRRLKPTRATVSKVRLRAGEKDVEKSVKAYQSKKGGKPGNTKQRRLRDLMLKGRTRTEDVEVAESEVNVKDLRYKRTKLTDADERARRDRERESNAHERDKVRSTTEELLNVAEDMVTEAKDSYEVVAVKGNKVVAKMPAEKMDIKDAVAALTKMHGGSEVQVHKNGKIVKMKG